MKFGLLILRKIIKLVAIRCQIFKAKMHQNRFRPGSLQRSRKLPSWNKEDLLLRERERCREEKERRGIGRQA